MPPALAVRPHNAFMDSPDRLIFMFPIVFSIFILLLGLVHESDCAQRWRHAGGGSTQHVRPHFLNNSHTKNRNQSNQTSRLPFAFIRRQQLVYLNLRTSSPFSIASCFCGLRSTLSCHLSTADENEIPRIQVTFFSNAFNTACHSLFNSLSEVARLLQFAVMDTCAPGQCSESCCLNRHDPLLFPGC